MSTVLNGGREKYFCGARKYEIPSEGKYKVDAGQIQSRGAQIRYHDWDKSDIKGFRQLSRGVLTPPPLRVSTATEVETVNPYENGNQSEKEKSTVRMIHA